MTLWLPPPLAQQLAHIAQKAAPQEACGVVLGHGNHITQIVQIVNGAANPERAYYIEEHALSSALFQAERDRLDLIGFFHSHPRGDAIPSPTDVREATYPNEAYFIVGLSGEPRITAWRLHGGMAEAIPLHISAAPPAPIPADVQPSTERMAVLISAVIAVLIVLLIAFTLLPPAPPIP